VIYGQEPINMISACLYYFNGCIYEVTRLFVDC